MGFGSFLKKATGIGMAGKGMRVGIGGPLFRRKKMARYVSTRRPRGMRLRKHGPLRREFMNRMRGRKEENRPISVRLGTRLGLD